MLWTRTLLVLLFLSGAAVFAFWRPATSAQTSPVAANKGAPSPSLPIAQVMLFSSGVGYFQRDGDVEGNAQIALSFPAPDVNDLLKSLVLQDHDGGKVNAVMYDSPDPVEKTLKSFALDLTTNPTFGEILNQARGEKVEIVLHTFVGAPPATLTGVIVGMQSQRGTTIQAESESLNLLCPDGMRSIALPLVQRVQFLNPVLQGEFQRALGVLAGGHNTEKKQVQFDLRGQGKRHVRVGYVVEHPIWKTSYRLVLNENAKPFLQGWAIVENTSDEDWKDVRMALISGRPVSFQMDLHQPLFVPRPQVEPELFASLRPPVYSGAMNMGQLGLAGGGPGSPQALGGFQLGGFGGGVGFGGGGMGIGGALGGLGSVNRYQRGNQIGNLSGLGQQGGMPRGMLNPAGGGGQGEDQDSSGPTPARLSYEEFQRRLQAKKDAREEAMKVSSALTAVNPREGVAALASAEEVGSHFQYSVNQKVNLPRQKSALLPIVQQDIEAARVSIFNPTVDDRHPVLGLRLKNTSRHPLVQGPVTVYEGGNYAGDARILDLQPNEERLIGFAMDLGTEVKVDAKKVPDELVAVKVVQGVVHASRRYHQAKCYLITNRSPHERMLLVEHPVRSEWKLVTPQKPLERSRDQYRFQLVVAPGKGVKLDVVEEQVHVETSRVDPEDGAYAKMWISSSVASPAVKAAFKKITELQAALAGAHEERVQRQADLQAILDDQARIRANLGKVPQTSAAFKRYLEKFDTQEVEIEKLQLQVKDLLASENRRKTAITDFLKTMTID